MKAKIFCISDNVLLGKQQSEMIAVLSKELFLAGFFIESAQILPTQESIIKKNATILPEEKIAMFFLVSSEGVAKRNLSQMLANIADDVIVENAFAKQAVLHHLQARELTVTEEYHQEFMFPSKARAIINGMGLSQGYVLQYGQSFVFVLPNKSLELQFLIKSAVLPYWKENLLSQNKTLTLKTFGVSVSDLSLLLQEDIKNKNRVSVSFFEKSPMVDVVLKAKEENEFLESTAQSIFSKISKFVYAEEDISLQEACFNLLKQSKQTIAIAESITCGQVASSLIKSNLGASSVVMEGIVAYTNQAKIDLLGVSESSLQEFTAVSSEVAYEMAAGFLERSGSDLVVATTGYANHENPALHGLCYIAIGNKNAIHIFKNKFSGTREENIDSATACALFFLIKKLRKNDFHFEKSIV